MDPTTRLLFNGAGGTSGTPKPLTAPLLFPTSRDSAGQIYVHGVRTNGTLVGSWASPMGATPMHAFFYNPFLVIHGVYGGTGYIVDCNTMSTYGTFSPSVYGYAPWQDGKYISVNGSADSFQILDVPTGAVNTYSYNTDAGYSEIAQNHMTVGFANNGSGLFSSLGSRYWWSIGDSGAPVYNYPTYYYYADKTSATSLGSRSGGYSSGNNYSRTYGISLSSSQAMFCNIGSNFFHVYSYSTSPTPFSPGTLSYGGVNHDTNFDSIETAPRCGANGLFYSVYRGYAGAYDYRFRIAYISPPSSTTPTDIGINLRPLSTSSSGEYYKVQNGTFMSQINTSGYVAVAHWDIHNTNNSNTNQLRICIRSGSSYITDIVTSAISSSMTNGNNVDYYNHGINGCSWSSNLLYSGATYN